MRKPIRFPPLDTDRFSSVTWALVVLSIILLTYKFVGYPIYITDKSIKNAPSLALCLRFLEPHEGELVSFPAPINVYQITGINKGSRFVKRLLAKDPEVEFRGNIVVVNGRVLTRDLSKWRNLFRLSIDNFTGKMGGYFVVGDVINSIDSRYFGTVKEVDRCIGII